MNKRIIVIDDQKEIIEDYLQILDPPDDFVDVNERQDIETSLFGAPLSQDKSLEDRYQVSSATQGEEGFNLVKDGLNNNQPFALAFIDMRMPPGWDGVQTAKQIRKIDDKIEIVIVTAYSDKNLTQIIEEVGTPERLLYLKKPFELEEIKQMAIALTRKWNIERNNEQFKKELINLVVKKTNELREKDIQLLEMDRIANIGTLAAGVAHEINNPMGFIKSSIRSIKKSTDALLSLLKPWANSQALPDASVFKTEVEQLLDMDQFSSALEGRFDRVLRGIERVLTIVSSLKNFSRVDLGSFGDMDVNQSILEAIQILKPQVEKQVNLQTEFQADLPLLAGYIGKINQSLLNILKNAWDAVAQDGTIRIITAYHADQDCILIDIIDDGEGMSEEVLKKAFNPFFTTRPVGTGTGLGLSLAERIISSHAGKIEILSTQGEGTQVKITLPRKSRQP